MEAAYIFVFVRVRRLAAGGSQGQSLGIELWLREKKRGGGGGGGGVGVGRFGIALAPLGICSKFTPAPHFPGSSRGYERRRGRGTFLGIISGGAE